MTAKRWITRLAESPRRDAIVFLLGVACGALYFAVVLGCEVGAAGDTPTYVELSRGVLSGSGFQIDGKPSATYPPGYPIFIAPFVAVFGGAGVPVVAVQWLLGGGCAVCVAKIAGVFYSRTTALVAGVGAATAPQLAMWEAYPISDVLGLTLLLGGSLLFFRALPPRSETEPPDKRKFTLLALGAGVLVAGSALVRPLSLSLAVPAMAWALTPWAGSGARRRIAAVVMALLAMAVVVAPWAIRNSVEFDGFYPLSTRNGWQLIQATEWDLEGRGTVGIDVTYPEEASGLGEGEADEVLTRIALNRISEDPGAFARRAGLKVLFFWLPTAPGLGLASLAMGLEFCAVAVLAASAFFRRSVRRGLIFWLMSAGASAGVALTILDPDYRYRLPVLMILMPPAAWSLSRIFRLEVVGGTEPPATGTSE